MFILCTGKVAKNPYCIPYSNINIFSLEELCYYIFHNIYNVTEEFFMPKLITWLRDEVDHPVLAKKCSEILVTEKPDLKDLVVTVLCTSDYYHEEEIRTVVDIMNNIENLPHYAKTKIKADNYLKYGQYGKAALVYRKLLQSSFAVNFKVEEIGDIMHNLGISHFYVSSFMEAANDFKEAYTKNHNPESANHYLYILLIQEEEELFENEAKSMGFSVDDINELKRKVQHAKSMKKDIVMNEEFIQNCKDNLRKAFAL